MAENAHPHKTDNNIIMSEKELHVSYHILA